MGRRGTLRVAMQIESIVLIWGVAVDGKRKHVLSAVIPYALRVYGFMKKRNYPLAAWIASG